MPTRLRPLLPTSALLLPAVLIATALGAPPAQAAYTDVVRGDTLFLRGDAASEQVALRPTPTTVGLDLGGEGTSEIVVDRSRFSRILIDAGAGDDVVSMIGDAGVPVELRGGDGNDTLLGADGDQSLAGGVGDDVLSAKAGADALDGGDGADRLFGDAGDDRVLGGAGDDELGHKFADGADRLDGGPGRDRATASGTTGDDSMTLSPSPARGQSLLRITNVGDQEIVGVEQLELFLLDGRNRVTTKIGVSPELAVHAQGGSGEDSLHLLHAADNRAVGLGGSDSLIGGAGDDDLEGGPGTDRIRGGEGADTVRSQPFHNADRVDGEGGSDSFAYSAGPAAEKISVDPSPTAPASVELKHDSDTPYELTGVETVDVEAGAGDDQVLMSDDVDGVALHARGGPGLNVLDGGEGDDRLDGGPEHDLLRGDGGDDTLHGGEGNDQLDGERGDDQLSGGGGDDIFTRTSDGLGNDVLDGGDGGADRIEIIGTSDAERFTLTRTKAPGRARIVRSGDNAVADVGTVERVLLSAREDEDIIDAANLGGVMALEVDGGEENDTIIGSAVTDELVGGPGRDVIRAGAGNDKVEGGRDADDISGEAGDDQMIWSAGDGDDDVEGGAGADTQHVLGNATNERFSVLPAASSGTLRVARDFTDEVFRLAGTEVVGIAMFGGDDELLAATAGSSIRVRGDGGEGDDHLTGGGLADDLVGGAGDDLLVGGAGDDRLQGRDGDDDLHGEAGNDELRGDAGLDRIDGGAGADLLRCGDAADVVVPDPADTTGTCPR